MTATAPIICKPLGELPLADVPAFPPAAAAALDRAHGIRTLADLQPHVEAQGDGVDAVRKTLVALGISGQYIDQATWSLLRHLNPDSAPEPKKKRARKEKGKGPDHHAAGQSVASAVTVPGRAPDPTPQSAPQCTTSVQSAPPGNYDPHARCCTPKDKKAAEPDKPRTNSATFDDPADFDENTPPPRTRPKGDALPRFLKVPPGQSIVALYWEWDKQGRIPAGSVLCEFIGTEFGTRSGYRVAATPWPPPLGEPGELVPLAKLDGWHCTVSVHQVGAVQHSVMSREGT